MTLRKRIILILSGLVVFVLAGPVIIFMAQGYSYDFKQNQIISSGTLVVKTEPRGARVSLDGNSLNNTPLTKRFIHPEEYLVEITKDGYHTWQKRVEIVAGQVTFLPRMGQNINLFLKEYQELRLIDRIADIFTVNNTIFYFEETGQSINRLTFRESGPVLTASTTTTLTEAKFIEARMSDAGDEFLLSSLGENWYITGKTTRRLPELSSLTLGQNAGTVIGLNTAQELVEIDGVVTKTIAKNVSVFQKSRNDIYYLAKIASDEIWLYHTSGQTDALPIISVPAFGTAQIIVSPENQVYLLLDRELYEIDEAMQKIRGNIDFASWDENGAFLLYGNNHEVWIYEPLAAVPHRLLLRSTVQVAMPLFHRATGYTFIFEGGKIKAVESDDSGQTNVYELLTTAEPKKFTLNSEGNILAIHDGQTLRLIQIR